MISVPTVVAEIIEKTPYVEEALSAGLLNLSAYARKIQAEVEERTMKNVNYLTIVMALKRHGRLGTKRVVPEMQEKPELILRSGLFEITIKNSDKSTEKQKNFFSTLDAKTPAFAALTRGVFETTLVAENRLKPQILTLFKDEVCISIIHGLSTITLKFAIDIVDLEGVYYRVLKGLAWDSIPFTEIVSTFSELTIVLKDEFVDRAFSTINRIF